MKAVLKADYYFNISISASSKIQKGGITRLHICTESHCKWIGRKLGRNTAEWTGSWVIPLWFPSTWCVSSAAVCQHGVFHNWFFTGVRADLSPLISQHQGFVCLPRLFGECLTGRRKSMPQALTCWAGRKCNSAEVGHGRKEWARWSSQGVYLKGIHSASHSSSPKKKRYFLSSDFNS